MKEYFQKAVLSNGHTYNNPVADGRVVVYTNMDLLAKAGITQWPNGWNEFVDMCATLKKNDITPILFAGAHSSSITHALTSAMVALRIYQNNPADYDKLKSADKSFAYNGEVVVQALKDIKMLADKGYFQEGFMGAGANDVMTALRKQGLNYVYKL
jgi:raffinose/stachyose/melibiose transport system substrate-binding protein